MLGKLTGWDDTIVALATAPGTGALGIIRLSGPSAIQIAGQLFPSKDLSQQPSHTLHVGLLKKGDEVLDEVVLSLFRVPKSYTGEDVVEISCHGSTHIEEKIIAAAVAAGARLARAGEFTQRAFLKGRIDLTQAEAVADLIASHSDAARLSALHTMRGGFGQDLKILREKLLGFSALIELELDFSQEDVVFADRKKFYSLIEEAQRVTTELIDSFKYGNVIRNGVQVAIVGKPNAGKSTLLNRLLNEERAIVSEIAGTTRDTIEETMMIEGIEFRLIDTAGIRAHTHDQIEQLGMDKTREKIGQADIVLEILDATSPVEEHLEIDENKLIRIMNKTDLMPEDFLTADHAGNTSRFSESLISDGRWNTPSEFLYDSALRQEVSDKTDSTGDLPAFSDQKIGRSDLIFISAKTSQGIDRLKRVLVDRVLLGKKIREGTVVTNARHHSALILVAAALSEIREGLDNGIPGDLISLDIRRALYFLGEITGEVTNEEQLSWIFGKFCIGK
jgi:tRNA modification GTPase